MHRIGSVALTSFGNLIKYARHVRKTGKCTPAGLKEFNENNDIDLKYDEKSRVFEINVDIMHKKPQDAEKKT